MVGIGSRVRSLASPRVLLTSFLVLGLVSGQANRGTMAYFTSTTNSAANVFTAGKVDISGSAISNTGGGGTTPSTTSLSFDTTTKGDCAIWLSGSSTASGTYSGTQPMTPGNFCTGLLTISNSNSTVDSSLRIRLVRASASSTSNNQQNDLLKVTMARITGTTPGAGDCAVANFNPGYVANANVNGKSTVGIVNKVIGGSGGGALALTGTINGAAPTEANMTTPTFSPAYSTLVGNDAVDSSGYRMAKNTDEYYCVMIYWPDTDSLTSQSAGENTAAGGANTYYINVTSAQWSGR